MAARSLRRSISVGLCAALLASCASDDSVSPDASPVTIADAGESPESMVTEAAPPVTFSPPEVAAATVDAFSELHDDEGFLPVATALRIFATVEPLPGVEPLEAAVVVPDEAPATALRTLRGATSELDPAIVEILDDFVELRDDDIEVTPGRSPAREIDASIGGRPATASTAAELAEPIAMIVAAFEELTGHEMSGPIRLRLIGGDTSYADAIGDEDRPRGCLIQYARSAFALDVASATAILAHEVWHCFQFDAGSGYGLQSWIIEGQAEWAGEAYVGGSEASGGPWYDWLTTPHRSLWRRSYDAIGIYSVAAQRGADPWQTMLPMLGQGNQQAIATLSGTSVDDVVIAAAQALVRAPAVADIWESTGPGIIDAQSASVVAPTPGSPAEATASVGRFATLPAVLAIPASDDVITITIEGGVGGAVQLQGTGMVTLDPGGEAKFCLREDRCVCPDGDDSGLATAQPGEGAAAVGSIEAASLSIRAHFTSLEAECAELVGVWVSTVGQQLASVLSIFGGGGSAPGCGDSPFTLVFTPEGSFSVNASLDCVTPEGSANGVLAFGGNYITDGAAFTLGDIVGSGVLTVQIGGVSSTIDVLDGYRLATSSPTPYAIDGDVLAYSFAGQSFTFTRAG